MCGTNIGREIVGKSRKSEDIKQAFEKKRRVYSRNITLNETGKAPRQGMKRHTYMQSLQQMEREEHGTESHELE